MSASWSGRTLGSRYELRQPLGSGVVADVYEAYDQQLQRPVAVKLLRPEWIADATVVSSFEQEAHLAAGLHHPHLAQIYDAGAEEGRPYIVMERVPGAPLDPARPPSIGQTL